MCLWPGLASTRVQAWQSLVYRSSVLHYPTQGGFLEVSTVGQVGSPQEQLGAPAPRRPACEEGSWTGRGGLTKREGSSDFLPVFVIF